MLPPMSASKKEAEQSILNFTAIFEEALGEYKRLTKEDPANHKLAKQLDDCNTPNSVLSLIRKQATNFDEFKSGNDKLMKWVNPIVHTLSACSSVLGDDLGLPFPPAKMIFTGIRVLLGAVKDTSASYDTLVDLFRRIGNSIQRLNVLTKLPLTPEMITLFGNTMAEVLEILAISSREMDQSKFKAYFKALLGKKEVKEALERLDGLTQEEVQMILARNLEITHSIKDDVGALLRGKAYDDLEKWLSPPNPSKNHNDALTVVYKENAEWFIQDDRYIEWKKNGSLLWISGSIGSGKSVLCSTIVEDIKTIQNSTSVLISYYYFDFKDIAKRDVCGLLSSILFQLAEQSEHCWTILSQLYASHKKSVRPSERALKECLQDMLELPEQAAIYVIVDALDECPDATTPSRREPVLKFFESLVELRYSNLRVCVTSRPEPDIRNALDPLTPTSCRVSLDDEDGQREDIRNYIRSFVESDLNMKKWRMGIKELVIKTLSDQSGGMFQWVLCQLHMLRSCSQLTIPAALKKLPDSLDKTYERALQEIPQGKREHAYCLFQCLIVAVRPLRVEELDGILAIQFSSGAAHEIEGRRLDDVEEDVQSACSSLISIVNAGDLRVVQFSHFSVQEFLTSGRLALSTDMKINHYNIQLKPAHKTVVQACLTVLLDLDGKVDKARIESLPFVFYAAQHWIDHALFEGVATQIQDQIERLFHPQNEQFGAWIWVHDVEDGRKRTVDDLKGPHPQTPSATPLYYASLCGFRGLSERLIVGHAQDVNAKDDHGRTPLHAALREGHLKVADLLLKHGAGVDTKDNHNKRPLETALDGQDLKLMQFLLGHGASTNTRNRFNKRPLEIAYHRGNLQAIELLLKSGADASLRDTYDWTPLHYASYHGQLDIVRLLLRNGANVNSKARKKLDWTPLHGASSQGHLMVVKELLDGGADVNAQDAAQHTPISIALRTGRSGVVELLREYIRDKRDKSSSQSQWHHRAMEILSENGIEVWWVVAIVGLCLMWLIQKISYFVAITVLVVT